jgi:hypothetical protein
VVPIACFGSIDNSNCHTAVHIVVSEKRQLSDYLPALAYYFYWRIMRMASTESNPLHDRYGMFRRSGG